MFHPQGAKAAQKRERNSAKSDAKGSKSQAKVNEAAKNIMCFVCKQTFVSHFTALPFPNLNALMSPQAYDHSYTSVRPLYSFNWFSSDTHPPSVWRSTLKTSTTRRSLNVSQITANSSIFLQDLLGFYPLSLAVVISTLSNFFGVIPGL